MLRVLTEKGCCLAGALKLLKKNKMCEKEHCCCKRECHLMPTNEAMYWGLELCHSQSSSGCMCLLAPPSSPSPQPILCYLSFCQAVSGLRTILPSFCDLVVGHRSEMAQQGVQQGWEECVGGMVVLGSTPLCIGYLNPAAVWFRSAKASERALPSGPCWLKLRRVKRSPGAGGGEHAHCCNRVQIQSLASEGSSQF